jgi:periplasmic protein TonB
MSLESSTLMIEIGMLVVIAITTILLLALRSHYRHVEALNLTAKYRNWKWNSPAEARTKYPDLDIFRISGSLRIYGIMVALIIMIFAFSWTNYDQKMDLSGLLGTLDEVIEMETPRTAEPPPPPPPPPPPAVQVVATDLPDIETKIFEDRSISEETAIEVPVIIKKEKEAPPPPPPPPPPTEDEREIFKVVEDAPTFPGCEEIVEKPERQQCAETKLLEFIYSQITYPGIARENGIEGMVYVRFVVERNGSISNIEVVRDVGGGCGDEAARVVKLMPKWNPGKQRGMPVRVMFTLPVKFDLK